MILFVLQFNLENIYQDVFRWHLSKNQAAWDYLIVFIYTLNALVVRLAPPMDLIERLFKLFPTTVALIFFQKLSIYHILVLSHFTGTDFKDFIIHFPSFCMMNFIVAVHSGVL